jgi:ornithine cyclodeaminase/alanine dehydrogenase-like protein (mu-crystallin family)
MILLNEQDIDSVISVGEAIDLLEIYMREKVKNPTRKYINLTNSQIVLTCGQSIERNISGFRSYWRYQDSDFTDDLTIVVDDSQNKIKGIILGKQLGLLRTGAIGGLAIKYLSNPNVETLGIIGTGRQALSQCYAAMHVRKFKEIIIYSRKKNNIEKFYKKVRSKYPEVKITKGRNIKDVVSHSDVLICATNSTVPLFPSNWLKTGVHINAIGPKEFGKHEICLSVADRCEYIVTDSIEQVVQYPKPFFLKNHSSFNSLIDLRDVIVDRKFARKNWHITMFCSVGLSGTEVILADEIIERHTKGSI